MHSKGEEGEEGMQHRKEFISQPENVPLCVVGSTNHTSLMLDLHITFLAQILLQLQHDFYERHTETPG
jgi:hypothetical protein